LAQYRELAAFSQFSSDLDADTQARLARGLLLTELLKQPQYSPLSIWQQVVTIMAGTSGSFDGIPAANVKSAQEALLTLVEQKHKAIIDSLNAGKPDEALQKKIAELAAGIAKQYHQEKKDQDGPN
jgi:F-type H+-transporting ATPase subunit alpha